MTHRIHTSPVMRICAADAHHLHLFNQPRIGHAVTCAATIQ